MKLIGITGTNGAGKGEIANYLAHQKGFLYFSAREFISRELHKRGLEVLRENTSKIANELRLIDPAYIVKELLKEAIETKKDSVIESIRAVGEIEGLRAMSSEFKLIAVDADVHVRYERILERKHSTDRLSFEQFKMEEMRESIGKSKAELNLPACIALADFKIINEGTIEELYAKVDEVLEKI